ncbi:hypothetical protein QYF36_026701 [Acer negundo]|nr:hypothetical protein QYF36_026701 [Acer negundo]
MSLQVSDIASASTQSVKRHTTTYHPSIWGDHFLKYASHSLPIDATTQEEYKELKHEVRRMLISTTSDEISEKLRLIDAVQRLGVAYHFEREIGDALDKIYNGCDDDDNNLHTAALRFRLLRQQGYNVPCDVFEQFKDDQGKFKASLIDDVAGMLCLYEAAYLGIPEEDILDEAIAFTTSHLELMVTDDQHQKELSNITEWWKILDFATKLPITLTKVIAIASVLDDTYDAFGTYEELKLLTDAIQRWDISVMDGLPEYMKYLYRALIDVYRETEEEMISKELGRSYYMPYAIEAMKRLVQAYFVEAKWCKDGYVPKQAFDWISNDPKIIKASAIIARLMDDIVSHEFEQEREHVASRINFSLKHIDIIFDIRRKLSCMGNSVVVFNSRASNSFVDMLAKRASLDEGDIVEWGDT